MPLLSVAVIGSSGGGVATMGHTDLAALLQAIDSQLQKVDRRDAAAATGSSTSAGAGGGGACLMHALMVSLDNGKGMDGANETTDRATLYIVDRSTNINSNSSNNNNKNNNETGQQPIIFSHPPPFHCKTILNGYTLKQVNEACQQHQQHVIATHILQGKIHGLICISCHVGIFRETLAAAARQKIPVTGSGGTSLAQEAVLYGIALSGNAGGSVATTSLTRAISYTHALSKAWKRDYRPWLASNTDSSSSSSSSSTAGPAWTSILNASLPAFWAACLSKRVLLTIAHLLHQRYDNDEGPASSLFHTSKFIFMGMDQSLLLPLQQVLQSTIHALEHFALPMVCSVVMATSFGSNKNTNQQQQHQQQLNNGNTDEQRPFSLLVMAAVLASVTCYDSCLAGLLAGYLVSQWSLRLLYMCIFSNIPATMTNLLTAGGVGGIVAIAMLPMAAILRQVTATLRWCIQWTVAMSIVHEQQQQQQNISVASLFFSRQALAGFTWGCWSCYGSKVGWYHAIHLPLILLEMEQANASFLGAIDELTLVLVCAGICAGNLVAAAAKTNTNTTTNPSARRPNSTTSTCSSSSKTLTEADVALCKRGLSINLSCGDFVEVCYPYMDESICINLGGYLASGLSSAWLVIGSNSSSIRHHHEPFAEDSEQHDTASPVVAQSLAYLPWPIAIWLAGPHWRLMAEASILWRVVLLYFAGSFSTIKKMMIQSDTASTIQSATLIRRCQTNSSVSNQGSIPLYPPFTVCAITLSCLSTHCHVFQQRFNLSRG